MYRKILIPLDGSALSEAALEHARNVIGPETEVLVLRVLEVGGEPVAATSSAEVTPIPPLVPGARTVEAVGEAQSKAFLDAEGYLQAKAAVVRGHALATRALVLGDSDPGGAIARVARDEQVDLIVMASHGRSGVARLMLGSVAEKVLHATHVPILLVRPAPPTS
jgi:nucleotide-binding universal stress UspA family protein